MRIRKATYADMPSILRCAKDFFIYADFAQFGLTLDDDSFNEMVSKYISEGIVLLLVDDDDIVRGGISGMASPWGFNKNITVVMELFFWVDPEYRGRDAIKMLNAFEKAARSKGADKLIMVTVNTDLADGVGRLYEKRGYMLTEKFFIKSLSMEEK